MYIVYLTLMLVNMAAAFLILALYIYRGLPCNDRRGWIPAFAITGFVALVTGLHMTFVWPMPGVYNMAFGEPSVMVGVLFLSGAWVIGKCWDITPLSVYAFLAGIAAVIIGIRFIDLGISQEPLAAGVGLMLSGLSGVLALPVIYLGPRSLTLSRIIQLLAVVMLVAAAVLWAYTSYVTYWGHMESFRNWNPNA